MKKTMNGGAYLLEVAMATLLSIIATVDSTSNRTMDILMPGITTEKEDEYWCTSVPAPEDVSYIISFEALPDGDRAHHMMLFACSEPASYEEKWPCQSGCKDHSAIMFAWAFHAEPTHLPQDVGFKIGGPDVRFITLQVHYRVIVKEKDHTGIRITITENRPQFTAGILIMVAPSTDFIPPHEEKHHMDMSCQFHGDTPIYPFAFRVHSHSLGRVITGYQYNNSWHLLGKGNPQWPQAFFPIKEKFVIKPGDILVSRCTYNSMDHTEVVRIGMTHLDEMCNYYIMYYTKQDIGKTYYSCLGNAYPGLVAEIPDGSDVTLPPNPLLEDVAHGKFKAIVEVPDWPASAPKLGQTAGVATDSHGHIHVFHRGTRVWDATTFTDNVINNREPIGEDVLLEFDASGKLIHSWGKDMFSMPHGLHIDNKDNIWITDVGLHQVMRFPAGHYDPDLVLGKKYVPGHGPDQFCKPTDVATLSNGEFYVSDGYCNFRVVKFSKDGKLLKEWGRSSSSLAGDGFPPPGDFSIPHSITVSEGENILCVADRENRRIQCFDLEGNFLRQIHSPDITGKVFAVAFNPVTGSLYAVNGADNYKKDVQVRGFTFDAHTGRLLQTWSPVSDSFQQAHDIAASLDGKDVYVVDIGPNRIWKFSAAQSDGIHKSVKKSGHPPTVDDDDDDDDDNAGDILEESGGSDFGASLIIGGLLIIPVMIVVIITVFLRLKKSGKLYYFFGNRNRNRRLDLGTLLSRGRQRFSPLSTDDKDPELDLLNSDSEIEEYSVTENNTA